MSIPVPSTTFMATLHKEQLLYKTKYSAGFGALFLPRYGKLLHQWECVPILTIFQAQKKSRVENIEVEIFHTGRNNMFDIFLHFFLLK